MLLTVDILCAGFITNSLCMNVTGLVLGFMIHRQKKGIWLGQVSRTQICAKGKILPKVRKKLIEGYYIVLQCNEREN